MPMRSLYHQSKVATKPPERPVVPKVVKKKGKAAAKPVVETVVVKKVKVKKENK